MSLETPTSSTPSSPELNSFYPEISRNCIELKEQLGFGKFGSVYKGLWNQAGMSLKVVALKKVFMLQKEADILSKIRHRNIIEFYGICKSESDFFIVTECAENGSLFDYLHHDENVNLDFNLILKWAKEIAAGISYLHNDSIVTIIHRDLKSKNIVLDAHLRCKICDFGTSKDLTHSCTAPTWGGTAPWMSPEVINQNEGLTPAADVWSYGVVLWEMLARDVPYKDYTEFIIYTLITRGIMLPIPHSCPLQLENLMLCCWKMNPKQRFTMKEILTELGNIENSTETRLKCQKFLENEDWNTEIDINKLKTNRMEEHDSGFKIHTVQQNQNIQQLEPSVEPPIDSALCAKRSTSCWVGNLLGAKKYSSGSFPVSPSINRWNLEKEAISTETVMETRRVLMKPEWNILK